MKRTPWQRRDLSKGPLLMVCCTLEVGRRVGYLGSETPPGLGFRRRETRINGDRRRDAEPCGTPRLNRGIADLTDRKSNSFSYKDLLECAHGRLFGPGNARLPLPPMLMFDRITRISDEGGANGKGEVEAEFDIKPDLWFFQCHFEDDPVMPGCLGMDALWQLLGFTLGWLGGPGSGRALSVGEVKFMGQVLPTAKLLKFHLDLKRIISRKLYLGIADGWVECDGEKVFEAKDIRVGLFANPATAAA